MNERQATHVRLNLARLLVLLALAVIVLWAWPAARAHADVPFATTYGGADYDDASAIQQTADGGYIVTGWTDSFGAGDFDAWVLKMNADGSVAWQKTYGGTDRDFASAIQQTGDGGYIVAGWTESFGSFNENAWVLKLNANGDIAWQKTYGGTDDEKANAIRQTGDGGYVVAGWTHSFGAGFSDVWVLKLNADGNIAWQKTYGGAGSDWLDSIQQTGDGGYVVAGHTDSFGAGGYYDAWVLKLNADGSIAWQKTYGGSTGDYTFAIQQTADGGYVAAGWTLSFGAGEYDTWVLKLNADGSVAWQKTYGGVDYDQAWAMQQTGDGGYVVAGSTESFGAGNEDIWILKLNADGGVAWQKTYGGVEHDQARAIQQTDDGGYVVTGSTESFGFGEYSPDVWMLKLNAMGNLCAGCGLGDDTSVTPADSNAAVADSSATPVDSSATAADSSATVNDTNVIPNPICVCFQPDLSVTKIVTPTNEVPYHGTVTYTVVLANNGTVSDTSVFLTDTLPAEVDFAWWVEQPAGAEVVADELTWQGTVTVGQATTFTFVVSHVGDYGDVVINTARFSGTLQTGEDDATFAVVGPDLFIAKAATPTDEVPYHGAVTYTVVLANGSPVSDTNVSLTDTLPVEVDFGRWVPGGQPAGAEVIADELTWSGTVTGGEAITFTFVVSHVGDYGDVVINTARFSGTLQTGEDDATFTVIGPDLFIAKTATPTDEVPYHGAVTYIVVLGNGSPVSDTNVLLTDTLPAEVGFARWVPGGQPAGAEIIADELTWQGTVTGGEAITFTFVVSHVGSYFDVVTNTVRFSGTLQAGDDSATFTLAGAPAGTPFAMVYGGANDDYARAIQQTADGGYIVVGKTESFGAGEEDVWILKLNASGSIAWQKTYGGTDWDEAHAVQQTADGGYVVAGYTNSFGVGIRSIWILKLNADGSIVWQKTYSGAGYNATPAIQQTADGGYVVVGWTSEGIWVLKLNADGSIAWQKTYGGVGYDYGRAIQQTDDGGYVVAGQTTSFGAGSWDAWVLKLDADGNIVWQKTYGGTSHDFALAIQRTSDEGYIVAGQTMSFGVDWADAWVLKLNADGSVAWQKTYGGGSQDAAWVIQQTEDGGYAVAGSTWSFGTGFHDAWVLKLDANGNVVWQKTYGGVEQDGAQVVQQTADGGYVVAANTESFGAELLDVWVLKLNALGGLCAGCDLGEDSTATPEDSNATTADSAATVVNSAETVTDSSATVTDTNVIPDPICTCAPEPVLSIVKVATPANDVAYHGIVTYTVVLVNSGLLSDPDVLLTDTLPVEVDFARWAPGGQPAGAEVVADELTWSGTVTAGQSITFTFVVSHVGAYGDTVINIAEFSGTLQAGEDDAIFTVAPVSASAPFAMAYGGADSDYASAIQQTVDGGYVVAGNTESFGAGETDAWVLKLNAGGSVAWQRTYGGVDRDGISAIRQTADGGYVMAGGTRSFGAGVADAWVLKLDADGSIAWQKTYGGAYYDSAHDIQQTADGGYIVAGETWSFGAGNSDAWVLKLDADGSVAWQKTYSGASDDWAQAIQQTADGGYVVAGSTGSFGAGDLDAWMLKLNADGSVAWQTTYGGADWDDIVAMQQTADGGYVVAGWTYSFGAGWSDIWVLKLDADGNVAWQKTYGEAGWEYAWAVQQTADGGYVVAGETASFGAGNYDAWVLKLDAGGGVTWQKTYGDGGTYLDGANTIWQTLDGGYAVAGGTSSFGAGGGDAWVLKLDADGGFCAGCALGEASTATPADSNATVANSAATVNDSGATVADSNATVTDTNVIPEPICVCSLEPDLFITKAATPNDDVPYHGTVTYTVVLGNIGTVSDPSVLLTDILPAEVDFGWWVEQPAGAEVVDDELTWQGTVTTGESITFTFVVSHVGDYDDTVTNTARFSGTLQAGEDDATFTVVEPQPALSITKDATPTDEIPYHGTVTYTVVLANGGSGGDPDVFLTDTLPIEVDFARWVEQPAGAEVVADELTWQGTVTAGESITFTFVVSHVEDYGDVVTNTARFSGTLQTGEDDATFTVVGPEPILAIAKDATPMDNVPYHGAVTYTVVLTNAGPGNDPDVSLTDTLPVEVDFARWVEQPAGAEVVDDALTWQGAVTAGQAITFTFVVTHVGAYGDTVTNTARFSGTLQAGEDSATFTVMEPESALSITKAATPTDDVPYHGTVTYTVVLINAGPGNDPDVSLTDTLPAEVDFARWVEQPVGAEVVADELTWQGTITTGQAITFTFVVSHVGDYGDTVTNTARFSGTLQAGEDSATFTVAGRATYTVYLPLVIKDY